MIRGGSVSNVDRARTALAASHDNASFNYRFSACNYKSNSSRSVAIVEFVPNVARTPSAEDTRNPTRRRRTADCHTGSAWLSKAGRSLF